MEDNREEQEADEIIRRLRARPLPPRPSIIMPMITRIMPTLIANEIIGVQPMTGKVGEIYNLPYNITDHDESQ